LEEIYLREIGRVANRLETVRDVAVVGDDAATAAAPAISSIEVERAALLFVGARPEL